MAVGHKVCGNPEHKQDFSLVREVRGRPYSLCHYLSKQCGPELPPARCCLVGVRFETDQPPEQASLFTDTTQAFDADGGRAFKFQTIFFLRSNSRVF